MNKQPLVCFDIDGTLIQQSPWGVFLRSTQIDARKRRLALPSIYVLVGLRQSKLLPETIFRRWWVHLMATLLKGKTHAELEIIFRETVETFYRAAVVRKVMVDRLKDHRQQGMHILLASGLLEDFAKAFAFTGELTMQSELALHLTIMDIARDEYSATSVSARRSVRM
ncbi:MAG UNVERIFIED_CONTAM: haloacid dehalogenase-like hydrolase [Anaerolineae bacterium]